MDQQIVITPIKTSWNITANWMWLILWSVCTLFVVTMWVTTGHEFVFGLVCLFLLIGVLQNLQGTIGSFVWTNWGVEKISREREFLVVRREIFGRGYSRKYEIAKIQEFQLTPKDALMENSIADYKGATRISFEYGFKKIGFCSGVPDDKADQIVQEVSKLSGIPVSRFAG